MPFTRKTNATTGKQRKGKFQKDMKKPEGRNPTQRQSTPPNERITHDETRADRRTPLTDVE